MKISKGLSAEIIIEEIGNRIKQHRINVGMTQSELAKMTGISVRNIVRIENGKDTNIKNIVRILDVFDLIDNFDMLIPDYSERPMYQIKKYKMKKRVKIKKDINDRKVKWGDEK